MIPLEDMTQLFIMKEFIFAFQVYMVVICNCDVLNKHNSDGYRSNIGNYAAKILERVKYAAVLWSARSAPACNRWHFSLK